MDTFGRLMVTLWVFGCCFVFVAGILELAGIIEACNV